MLLAALPNSFMTSSKRQACWSTPHTLKPLTGTVMSKQIASTCSVLSFAARHRPSGAVPVALPHYDANHHLQYQTDPLGNKILDFSYAGYQGGGVALPNLPVRVTVQPSGGDDTANIQNAINQIAQLSPDFFGFHGAVLLTPAAYLSPALYTPTPAASSSAPALRCQRTVIAMTGAHSSDSTSRGTGS